MQYYNTTWACGVRVLSAEARVHFVCLCQCNKIKNQVSTCHTWCVIADLYDVQVCEERSIALKIRGRALSAILFAMI
jgi:hypothetical protein